VATLIFDTHKAVKSLEEAGFEESQAEAVVEMVSGAVGENVATKSDLQTFEQRMDAQFEAFEQRMTISSARCSSPAPGCLSPR
jgi:hypothetical protein